ncbi:LysR family transcriptional regulator ArgP [Nocardioides sp. CFH 31398]|uniref:LysR family transcriptional regulator ArgP n=1 Tax=Nocardioides sp. CFH 31398 TaxID=2919579 RepID=UPI001F065618|nr:LysR family transcriptional regulator ArgP [Nocardioides sp. CFH 31398]MCH1864954.1 LysR family transcriptional regulator ArgP [Nocardioides sp. CFH 31398]
MYAPDRLAALAAVVDGGTFEAAARALHVTPSAVSQRVRALEQQVGQVVVTRTAPCRPTGTGEVLLGLARQTALLAAETTERLGESGGVRRVAVAVNADSLATWFRAVLAEVAGWPGVALELHVADQDHTTRLLRTGRVLAAVTAESAPVQGCTARPLGVMRYHPVAAPGVLERARRADGGLDWRRLPMVRFDEDDALQHDWLAAHGHAPPDVVHRVPTTADLVAAIRCGLGWGMALDHQLADPSAADLVRLADEPVLVPLYWQRWRVDSPTLARLTDAVLAAAARP